MQVGNWSDIFMYVGRRSFRHFSCRKVQDSIHHLQNYLCIELAFQNVSLLSSLTSASSETNSSIVFPSFNNLEWETFIQQGPMRPLLFQVRTYLVQPKSKIHFIIHRCRSSEKTTKLVNKKLLKGPYGKKKLLNGTLWLKQSCTLLWINIKTQAQDNS